MESSKVLYHTLFTEFDISLFKTGKHFHLYQKFGSHVVEVDGISGCYFAVYAPNAEKLYVVGDFNAWDHEGYMLYSRWDGSGIWEGFVPGVSLGTVYKYKIFPYNFGRIRLKTDPFAIYCERPPLTGSRVWNSEFEWSDKNWMEVRVKNNALDQPCSVYEMHFGSWMRHTTESRSLTYREMAEPLVAYLTDMGYTHVEFLPLTEYPYDPSWGYQVSGYFATTSRYGTPEDLMYLIDVLHKNNIGVIMDWVPAHFPADDHSLATFDGSCVYEHPDKRKGYHPDWNTLIFNFGRPEIRSFLISSAFYWFEKFHIDGVRVDAVSSLVHLDYSRKEGEWEPNQYGGRENLDAISFLQEFNTAVYAAFPGIQTIAEESTSYPMVSRPVFQGGLGFGMKWMMGWMHDTLDYFKRESMYRKFHQNDITFSIMYAFSENFMLALSHDEVVHGKSSMIGKMAGDEWQKFANLRALYTYMYSHPGTKLLFMGNDMAPYTEWNFTWQLDWSLLKYAPHKGLNDTVKELNHLYRNERALHHYNFNYLGFEWIDAGDRQNSILIYKRKSDLKNDEILIIANFNIKPQPQYKIGLSEKQSWKLLFNSDAEKFWGSQYQVFDELKPVKKLWNGRPYHVDISIPPLSVMMYKLKVIKRTSSVKIINKTSKGSSVSPKTKDKTKHTKT